MFGLLYLIVVEDKEAGGDNKGRVIVKERELQRHGEVFDWKALLGITNKGFWKHGHIWSGEYWDSQFDMMRNFACGRGDLVQTDDILF
jgi:hypothetical protein